MSVFQNKKPTNDIQMPLLPLRDIVIFPHMVVPLFVGRKKSINALANAMSTEKNIFLSTQTQASVDNPDEKDFSHVGTIGKVLQILRLPDGTVKAMVEGKERAEIINFIDNNDFFQVQVQPLSETQLPDVEVAAYKKTIISEFEKYIKLNKSISRGLVDSIAGISNISKLADTVAAHFPFKVVDKQRLLQAVSIEDRLPILLDLIRMEIEFYTIDIKVKERVKEQMAKTQKNYYLNEQMRAIKKEMGEQEEQVDELKELHDKIKKKKMPDDAKEKVEQEFKKLKMMAPMSAEATVVRNYIDWLIGMPWFEVSDVSNDIEKAENILNEDHYGLEKPKERILEYLAVQVLVKKMRGPILCLVGPPGVGKTSIAKSVARATGRKYIRLSLGGVRDEAEIRGHRRTYIGAMPGKIIQSLKKVGVNNPVMCLDEVDKMSMDFRGDPSAALLEVLDPEQNFSFNDHYLDVDYDLSDIFFITTANTTENIPLPLQDRMEIIRLPGYAEYEKFHIANDFLINKQLEANGLKDRNIIFNKKAILTMIREYTREAGVRNLEREIASVCRKIAREMISNKKRKTLKVTDRSVHKYLGTPRYKYGQIEKKDQIGLVTGLAWTSVGGELLSIETSIMPGKGDLTLTGKLGDVMKESAQAAVSYVRSRAECLMIDSSFFRKNDIHIHIPEGAIPKDGPSAGISICTSIVSAITKRAVFRDIAMTGEITLRGRILAIGGLKEKILAAHRGGIRKVVIPSENEKDLKDIPEILMNQIDVVLVEHMDEVLPHAIVHGPDEQLFKEDDMPFGIINENSEQQSPLI